MLKNHDLYPVCTCSNLFTDDLGALHFAVGGLSSHDALDTIMIRVKSILRP